MPDPRAAVACGALATGPIARIRAGTRALAPTACCTTSCMARQARMSSWVTRAAGSSLEPKPTQFAPQARGVIMLMQNGGPGQMELFDPKPDLASHAGQTFGEKVEMFQKGSEANKLLASPFKFQRHRPLRHGIVRDHPAPGRRGRRFLPGAFDAHRAQQPHRKRSVMFNTGKIFPGRPALGSWVSYALGPKIKTCPLTSCCAILRATIPAVRCCGKTPGCRRCIAARNSAQGPAVLNLR